MVNKYPEHEKMQRIEDQSQIIGEFLNWIQNIRYVHLNLCYYHNKTSHWYPQIGSIEDILAEYFEIDLKKIEQEKRAMLEEMRLMNLRKK